ncbi:MAG: VanW family protein [Agathobacter sp.]|nr:VanW family protein [Agathobacter sp.]
MRRFRQWMLAVAIMLAFMPATCGKDTVNAAQTEENRIADGIYIGKVNVSGMTEAEAEKAVDAYMESLRETTFTFTGPNGSMEATAEEMGVHADATDAIQEALTIAQGGNLISRYKEISDLKQNSIVLDLYPEVDKQATAQLIYAQIGKLNIEAVDNGLVRENDSFTFVEGKTGTEVNIVESVYAINDYLAHTWDGTNNEIALVTDVIEPRGTKEELAQVKDLIGSFSTDFSSSTAGRATNVKNGCSKINGSLLFPGDTFSVYDTISPFTEENGYALATAYASGKVVESIGGGICQVSTTLYNAIIRAEVKVTMRYNHSMLVSYVDPSDDAAIASGLKDFQFVNNMDYPIYIEGYCSNGIITMNVYGVETRPSNRKISFESEVISESEPKVEYTLSDEFDAGYWKVMQSEHRGMEARLWKVVTVDGVEESREIFNNSSYREGPKEVTIGTKNATEEWLKNVKAAIKNGDEATVKAAVAAANEVPAETPSETVDENTGEDTADKPKKDQTAQPEEETDSENAADTDGTDETSEAATGGDNTSEDSVLDEEPSEDAATE